MSVNVHYTTDPRRIRTLQRNYDLGVEREKMSREVREAEDVNLLRLTREDVVLLHVKALRARMKILDTKRGKSRRSRRTEDDEDEGETNQ